jgi:hypothetical protein
MTIPRPQRREPLGTHREELRQRIAVLQTTLYNKIAFYSISRPAQCQATTAIRNAAARGGGREAKQMSTTPPTTTLGSIDPVVGVQGLGCMGMSEFYGPTDGAEALATLDRALELGVTLFDTIGPFVRANATGWCWRPSRIPCAGGTTTPCRRLICASTPLTTPRRTTASNGTPLGVATASM